MILYIEVFRHHVDAVICTCCRFLWEYILRILLNILRLISHLQTVDLSVNAALLLTLVSYAFAADGGGA